MPNDPRSKDAEAVREAADDPPAKRFRRDPSAEPPKHGPSMVVHVGNVNSKASEGDLIEAFSPFGEVAYVVCVPHKRMALVEFDSLQGARSCVAHSQNGQIFVAGEAVRVDFSKTTMLQRVGLESEMPNHVLVLSITNAIYPVHVDVIHEICKPHGDVKRIAMVRGGAVLQALVEFADVETARRVKHALNGADIYSDCCSLKVEFAKPDTVFVSHNDQDQWDYTREPQPSLLASPVVNNYRHDDLYQLGTGDFRLDDFRGDRFARVRDFYDERKVFERGQPTAFVERRESCFAAGDARLAVDQGFRDTSVGSSVVMVYGITPQVNCDMLFNLLCQYGNVNKVLIMTSKAETAMVEMGSPIEASTAIDRLSGASLFGHTLSLNFSKQTAIREIRDPYNLPDGSPSYRDFTTSRSQRFSSPEIAARNRLVGPSKQLYWYNAPPEMNEEKLKELFHERKATQPQTVTVFSGRSARSASGICEFENEQLATDALALTNHARVESPSSPVPYILKLAFGRDRI